MEGLTAIAGAFAATSLLTVGTEGQGQLIDIIETPEVSAIALSPDGLLVAFRTEQASVASNTYETSWWVAASSGEPKPVRVADGGDLLTYDSGAPRYEMPIWSEDSRSIYFRAGIAGAVQVWRAATDGSGSEQMTYDDADVISFAINSRANKLIYDVGARRAEIASAEENEYYAGIRIDRTVPLGQSLFRSGFVNGALRSQRFGADWLDRVTLLADGEVSVRSLDLDSRAIRDASRDDRGFLDANRFYRQEELRGGRFEVLDQTSGRTAFVQRDGLQDRIGYYGAEPGASDVVCALPVCTEGRVIGVAWRNHSDEIVLTLDSQGDGLHSLWVWDVSDESVRRIFEHDGSLGGWREGNCEVNDQYALCPASGANQPPRVERIDLDSGASTVLFDPPRPPWPFENIIVEPLRWADAQGAQHSGYLIRPPQYSSEVRHPLFIHFYNCRGFLRGGVGDEWPFAAFVNAGIAALCVNQGRFDPAHQDSVAMYERALEGIASAIDMLAERGTIDRERIGMGGVSFGSEVTMWVAMESDLLSAVSIATPPMTPNWYWFHVSRGETFLSAVRRVWGIGSPEETPDAWTRLSPALRIADISVPILIQAPEQEYLQAAEFLGRSLLEGAPIDVYAFPHASHIKYQPRQRLAVYDRNMDWFRFWLLDEESTDPAKAERFATWRGLRQTD